MFEKLNVLMMIGFGVLGIVWIYFFAPLGYDAYLKNWSTGEALTLSWLLTLPLMGVIGFIPFSSSIFSYAEGGELTLDDAERFSSLLLLIPLYAVLGVGLDFLILLVDWGFWDSPEIDFFGTVLEIGLITSGLSTVVMGSLIVFIGFCLANYHGLAFVLKLILPLIACGAWIVVFSQLAYKEFLSGWSGFRFVFGEKNFVNIFFWSWLVGFPLFGFVSHVILGFFEKEGRGLKRVPRIFGMLTGFGFCVAAVILMTMALSKCSLEMEFAGLVTAIGFCMSGFSLIIFLLPSKIYSHVFH